MANKNKRKLVSSAAPYSTFKVDFCNIRGIHSNLNDVHHHLETAKPSLFFLTETQISRPADDSYLYYPGYKLEHTFVPRAGVCMYVRDDICCRRLSGFEALDFSTLWASVDCGGQSRVYVCVYRSHSGDAETTRLYENISNGLDRVLEKFPTAEIVVLGDFNGHHADWLGSRRTDHAGRAAHELALTYGLSQLVTGITRLPDVHNHEPSLLDLMLTTRPANYQVAVDAPLGSSDHCLVRTTVPTTLPDAVPLRTRQVWHYQSADWDGLREFFSSYPWLQLCFASVDPSICADSIADVVLQGMECFIPNSRVRVGGRSQPWFNRSCADAAKAKRAAYKTWAAASMGKDPKTDELKKRLNAASRLAKKTAKRARCAHISRIGEQLASYPSGSRAFWSLAKAAEGNFCRSALPPLRKPDDSLAHSAKEKADIFGSLFASNSTLDDGGAVPPSLSNCECSMQEIRITQAAVRKVLWTLDERKSSGPDGIPAIVLKKCAPELSPVLTRLFSLSYNSGIVPSSWKVAHVHPIPKKGDRSDPTNYRPIAITSLLSKVMERVINSQLLRYLEEHQLISDRQYGFRHGRSAGDLLVYLTHRWGEAIESRGEALAVSLDIAKAFDRVWHRALLAKLPSYGVPEGLCTWIGSFLHGRCIRAVVDGACSETMSINAGVPQGSVLSPTLFILHINDLLQISNIHCYADDSTGDAHYLGRANAPVSEVMKGRAELVSSVECSLEQVTDWGKRNQVQFNPSKTQAIAFTAKKSAFNLTPRFQGIPLTLASNISILGVNISSEVQFRSHLENKAGLTSKKLGVLNRAKRYFTPNQRLMLYKAQVRPHMEYCSHLWSGAPKYQLDPLDSLQRRAVRLVNDPKLSNRLESLSVRRDVGSLCLFYRYFNGECSDEIFNLIPPSHFYHRTGRYRQKGHPHIIDTWKSRTTRFNRLFLPRTCKLWNALPPEVFPQVYNLNRFKRDVNRVLSFNGRQRTSNAADITGVHRRR